jgi:hypothetical protein
MASTVKRKKKEKQGAVQARPAKPARMGVAQSKAREPWGAANGDWIEQDASFVRRPIIKAAHGLALSSQAGPSLYCVPRQARGPFESVEVGFPSEVVEELMPWAEDPASPMGTVYGRVPVAVLAAALFARGGRCDKQADWKPEAMGLSSMRALAAGKMPKPRPPSTGRGPNPRRFHMELGAKALEEAALAWMQEAALGSPWAERAARLDVWSAGELVMDWRGCAASLASVDPSLLGQNDLGPWARGVAARCLEVSQLREASKEPAAPVGARKPRKAL